MSIWWWKTMSRKKKAVEEKEMNKPKFVSAGIAGDGKAPAKTPWGAALRTPVEVVVPPADNHGNPGKVRVKLGLSCDCPVLVYAHSNVTQHGLNAPDGLQVVSSGEELTLVVENPSTTPVRLMESTMLLNVSFLPACDFDYSR